MVRMPALVAMDVDGTIAGPGGLYAGAEELLDAVTAAGLSVALCSARPVGSLRVLAERFQCVRFAAALQGSQVWQLSGGASLVASWALDATAGRALAESAARRGFEVWWYSGPDWFVTARTAAVESEVATAWVDPVVVADVRELGIVHKVLVLGGWGDRELGALGAAAGLRVRRSQERDLEVIGAAVPPSKGLQAIAAAAGIELDAVMAVGDGDNDIGMLQAAGEAYALAPLAERALWPGVTRLPAAERGGLRHLLELLHERAG